MSDNFWLRRVLVERFNKFPPSFRNHIFGYYYVVPQLRFMHANWIFTKKYSLQEQLQET